jgi:hypothetical protein
MGTSLALVGAYVLAAELATGTDHTRAFAAFEATMRPYVAGAPKLPPGTPGIAYPSTRAGIGTLRALAKLAGSPLAQRLAVADRLAAPPADRLTLPDFFPAGRGTSTGAALGG